MASSFRAILITIIAVYGLLCRPCLIQTSTRCDAPQQSLCCAATDTRVSGCAACSDCLECCDGQEAPNVPLVPPAPLLTLAGLDWFPIPQPSSVCAGIGSHPTCVMPPRSHVCCADATSQRSRLCVWVI